ncbi:MAG TPA: rhomboid family intramembrane serine protease [Bacteroidia bacterium]|jgi:membrane associated rhomboid family serine protease|nr:rhomboid family intramembrane serine protease [Bacteroidia bacterium]
MSVLDNIKTTFQQQSKLTVLIILNVSVYLTLNISSNIGRISLTEYFAMPLTANDFIYKFWTVFTYMFTHVDLMHILFNLLLLYFSGRLFYSILGEKRLVYVYVMSGVLGGALLLLLAIIFPEVFAGGYLLGASAAVLGIIMVMAVYTPDYPVFVFFLEMRFKYFALLVFVTSTVIDFASNTGGKIAHIGGALFGLLYGYQLKKGNDIFEFSFLSKPKSKMKIVHKNTSSAGQRADNVDESYLNKLLDKISKSGYDSLTAKEKDDLFKLSQKK